MGNVLCVQNSQRIGHGNAVVAAKGRALGAHIAAVYDRVDGILLKIQRAVGGLVAHHVQKAVGLGELHAVVAQCLFVVGGVRNAADLLKVIKNRSWFQIG